VGNVREVDDETRDSGPRLSDEYVAYPTKELPVTSSIGMGRDDSALAVGARYPYAFGQH
jgi:hypothetical protein